MDPVIQFLSLTKEEATAQAVQPRSNDSTYAGVLEQASGNLKTDVPASPSSGPVSRETTAQPPSPSTETTGLFDSSTNEANTEEQTAAPVLQEGEKEPVIGWVRRGLSSTPEPASATAKPAPTRKRRKSSTGDISPKKTRRLRKLAPKPADVVIPPLPPILEDDDEVSPTTQPQQAPSAQKRTTRASKPSLSIELGEELYRELVGILPPMDFEPHPAWSEIEPLLPGSLFGGGAFLAARHLWTERDESLLRSLWTAEDESLLLRGSTRKEEVKAGVAMRRIYGCRLQDLFRYGLRPPLPDPRVSVGHPLFWTRLLRLLPHPYFRGDVAHLRYALQQAVAYRVGRDGHTTALMPPWSRSEPGFVAYLTALRDAYPAETSGWERKTAEIAEVAQFRCRMRVRAQFASGMLGNGEQLGHDLNSIMAHRKSAEQQQGRATDLPTAPQPGSVAAAVSDVERWLFFPIAEDMVFLEACLDEMDRRNVRVQDSLARDAWKWTHPPDSPLTARQRHELEEEEWVAYSSMYRWGLPKASVPLVSATAAAAFEAYWHGLGPEERGELPGQREAYLAEKRLGILAERREGLIRLRVDPRRTDPAPAVEVLDVPPFDPNPDFGLFDTSLGLTNPDNLVVVRGLVPAPALYAWLNLYATWFPWARPRNERGEFVPERQGLGERQVLRLHGGGPPRRSEIQGNMGRRDDDGSRQGKKASAAAQRLADALAKAQALVEEKRAQQDGEDGCARTTPSVGDEELLADVDYEQLGEDVVAEILEKMRAEARRVEESTFVLPREPKGQLYCRRAGRK